MSQRDNPPSQALAPPTETSFFLFLEKRASSTERQFKQEAVNTGLILLIFPIGKCFLFVCIIWITFKNKELKTRINQDLQRHSRSLFISTVP